MSQRRRKIDPGLGVNLGLIITPMLDMAFQLMAFFIMTYPPSPRESVIDGALLPAAASAASGALSNDAKKIDTKTHAVQDRQTVRVVVKARPSGSRTVTCMRVSRRLNGPGLRVEL